MHIILFTIYEYSQYRCIIDIGIYRFFYSTLLNYEPKYFALIVCIFYLYFYNVKLT